MAQEEYINIDCTHVHEYDPDLYAKITSFPQETIPLMDDALVEIRASRYPNHADDALVLHVRPFHLLKENRLRDLDPSDIDRLVSVRGMVTRTSQVIPNLRCAVFECGVCGACQDAPVEHHRVTEPTVCLNQACQGKETMVSRATLPP